jgi:hypothetical protein
MPALPKSLLRWESRELMVINTSLSSGSVARTLEGQGPGPPGELMVFRSSLERSPANSQSKT